MVTKKKSLDIFIDLIFVAVAFKFIRHNPIEK